jgi:Fe-S cluster assembly protein SufD
MSAALQDNARRFVARYESARGHLPGDASVRAAAATTLRDRGLPTPREEAWRWTNLRPLADFSPAPAAGIRFDPGKLLALVPAFDGAKRVVFVDGRFHADLSAPPVGFTTFLENPSFGATADPARERLVALNTMFAEDGARIDVPASVDGGVVVLAGLGSPGAAYHPRHAVRLAAGARLTLVEVAVGEGTYLHNPVTEIEIGEGATLVHIRLQDESRAAFHLATFYADIAARGTYDSFALTLGGRLTRAEVHARLLGPGAATHLNAAQLLGGTQHADFTTVVRHDAPSCASRQTVKNVLTGHSRGVFQGRIQVARAAQKTDGYQMNQALLLSADAEIDSKPELEIFADDVKCSHGATVGELDPAQIFYLRSRGIPEAEARAILVHAFLVEAFDAVAHEGARAALVGAVDAWWARQVA